MTEKLSTTSQPRVKLAALDLSGSPVVSNLDTMRLPRADPTLVTPVARYRNVRSRLLAESKNSGEASLNLPLNLQLKSVRNSHPLSDPLSADFSSSVLETKSDFLDDEAFVSLSGSVFGKSTSRLKEKLSRVNLNLRSEPSAKITSSRFDHSPSFDPSVYIDFHNETLLATDTQLSSQLDSSDISMQLSANCLSASHLPYSEPSKYNSKQPTFSTLPSDILIHFLLAIPDSHSVANFIQADRRISDLIHFQYPALRLTWLIKAASLNDTVAQINLARFYENGSRFVRSSVLGSPPIYSEFNAALISETELTSCVFWYTHAAEAGNASAMFLLGRVLADQSLPLKKQNIPVPPEIISSPGPLQSQGTGIQLSSQRLETSPGRASEMIAEAQKWLCRSAEQGLPLAQYRFALIWWSILDSQLTGNQRKLARQRAYDWFLKSAEQGVVDAMYLVGRCHIDGSNLDGEQPTRNPELAVEWFQKAVNLGSNNARAELGRCYRKGIGCEKDEKKAVECYIPAAFAGVLDAMFDLGRCYLFGWGIEKPDPETAVKWFIVASERGDRDAANCLGQCLEGGKGIAKDEVRAVSLYRLAAERGSVLAQMNLGSCYRRGIGNLPKSRTHALEMYRLAAIQGEAFAQVAFAQLLNSGELRNPVDAADWYKRAANQGDPDALNSLLTLCSQGHVVETDLLGPIALIRRQAELGEAPSLTALGNCYRKGLGVPKNFALAVEHYTQAATNGDSFAHVHLGRIFQTGWLESVDGGSGTPIRVGKNHLEAVKWFEKAAIVHNCDFAQTCLADCFENGKGTAKDLAKAKYWYAKAVEQANVDAMTSLGDILKSEGCVADAMALYMRAANEGSANAMYKIAFCYRDGWTEGTRDLSQAVFWCRRSAKARNLNALIALVAMVHQMKVEKKRWENENDVDIGRETFELCLETARNGSGFAFTALGDCFRKGVGCPVDLARAMVQYIRGANQGDVYSMTHLGRLFQIGVLVDENGERIIEEMGVNFDVENKVWLLNVPDVERAVKWFKKAVEEHQDGFAMLWLGDCYMRAAAKLERKCDRELELRKAKSYFLGAKKKGILQADEKLRQVELL
ncbi:hypothetical protein HK096_003553 [Nowakowskiella sp. JEL0078]|nr:hypothetical protein HK096_003553 [Nowakowskiella sp. JEL0078]